MIGSTRKVRKRDGREVPYDQGKIAGVILRAARSAGGGDPLLAEELASVVTLFIEREWNDRVPSIEDVSDLIERVLVETGHGGAAKAFILERDRRARIRSSLRVRDDERPLANGSTPTVDARSRATNSTWSKGRIVEALMVEGDLAPAVAEDIAAEVERKVFASGLTRVSTQLIRALVDNELFERGHDRILNRQALIGLPRYDVDRLARGGGGAGPEDGAPGSAAAADRRVADGCWSQYALLAAIPGEAADAHMSGVLHVAGLETPTRLHALELDLSAAGALPCGAVDPLTDEGAEATLRLLHAALSDAVAAHVTYRGLERFGTFAAAALADAAFDPVRLARRVLLPFCAPRTLPRPRPDVRLVLPCAPPRALIDLCAGRGCAEADARSRYAAWVIALFQQASRLSERLWTPAPILLVTDGDPELGLLEQAALTEAGTSGAAIAVEPPLGGTLQPVVSVVARMHVNVAQAAFRARRFEIEALNEVVAAGLRAAAGACEARARWLDALPGCAAPRERLASILRQHAGMRDALAAGRASRRFEIALAGVDAASRVAFDRPLASDPKARAAIVALRDRAAALLAEESRTRQIPFALAFTDEADVLERLGSIDFDRFPRGRDVHGVPHDGSRYLYAPTAAHRVDEVEPEAAAAIEAELRRGILPAPLPAYHSHASRRARFVRHFASRLHRDPS